MIFVEKHVTPDHPSEGVSTLVSTTDWGETGRDLREHLAETGTKLRQICGDADPRFIQIGRDLQAVANETSTLTETIQRTACLIGTSEEMEGPLARSDQVVQKVITRLNRDRQEIEQELEQIHDLVSQISDCRSINDAIDRISASFRAVRINIRIQCCAQLISEEIFREVTEDIDTLSRTLTRIAKEIKSDLAAATKKLVNLERIVAANLLVEEKVSANAMGLVSRAYGDIKQMFAGSRSMVREAGRRSEVIADRVADIIVAIQFHDSLIQRTDHILHAFADVTRLCTPPGEGNIKAEALGSAFLILDLQHRQLTHIVDEINSIHEHISHAFSVIGEEVKGLNSILIDTQFKAVGPQQFLRNMYTSLQSALFQLSELVSEGTGMIDQINTAAAETRFVATNLMNITQNIMERREETRLQAVNTIIMASNLGQRGRTIQVLAKEISALSENTGELVDDLEVIHQAVNHKVEKLCTDLERSGNDADRSDLREEIFSIDGSFLEVEKGFAELSAQIDTSSAHVETVQAGLLFIQQLREGLREIVALVEQARDTLLPWRELELSASAEMNQLIERYTMEQERLIHLFDRADAKKDRQGVEDILF